MDFFKLVDFTPKSSQARLLPAIIICVAWGKTKKKSSSRFVYFHSRRKKTSLEDNNTKVGLPYYNEHATLDKIYASLLGQILCSYTITQTSNT